MAKRQVLIVRARNISLSACSNIVSSQFAEPNHSERDLASMDRNTVHGYMLACIAFGAHEYWRCVTHKLGKKSCNHQKLCDGAKLTDENRTRAKLFVIITIKTIRFTSNPTETIRSSSGLVAFSG
jgi:hypothetical protein